MIRRLEALVTPGVACELPSNVAYPIEVRLHRAGKLPRYRCMESVASKLAFDVEGVHDRAD